jgi:hypothetical protein
MTTRPQGSRSTTCAPPSSGSSHAWRSCRSTRAAIRSAPSGSTSSSSTGPCHPAAGPAAPRVRPRAGRSRLMPLPSPDLDDRTFAMLVDEARQLVMARAPGWTDLSAGDPGITLLEAFAYLADTTIFRLNQVPDKLYVEFLRLIGARIQPPRPRWRRWCSVVPRRTRRDRWSCPRDPGHRRGHHQHRRPRVPDGGPRHVRGRGRRA